MMNQPMDVIDPHVHCWQLAAGHYAWLRSENPPFWPDKTLLQHDYPPAALQLQSPFRLTGVVAIEAGFNNQQPEQELAWFNRQNWPCLQRSVAFLDCAAPLEQVAAALESLAEYQPAGVRHIFEGEDEVILHRPELNTISGLLCQQQLLLEVQCNLATKHNLARIIQLAEHFPELTLVLNHAGLVTPATFAGWQQSLSVIANYPNIFMKLSGWEMLHSGCKSEFDTALLQQVLAGALAHLPTERLMLAGNFPLCLWQGSYQQLWLHYWQCGQQLGLSQSEWQQLSQLTATQCYGL